MLIGADAAERKMVLAVESGQRKSTESWATVLRDLKARGLRASKAHDRRSRYQHITRPGCTASLISASLSRIWSSVEVSSSSF